MAWTYDTLLAAVRAYLDPTNDGAFDGQFPTFVRQAEERILHVTKAAAFRHTQSFAGITTETVAELTGFVAPIFLAAGNSVLLLKDNSWMAEVFGTGATGSPQFYSLRTAAQIDGRTQVRVAPRPAVPTTFVMEYWRKPMSLTEVPAGEATWISTNAENALFQGVLFYAYQYEKGEADMLNSYLMDFEKAMSLLKGIARTEMRRDENRASPQAMPEA